jgi:diketogulonate reductase-like aldo/keto reductase
MKTMNETFTLYNGVKIPKLGFGTWQISNGPVCYDNVTSALKSGYRHIDTASAYGNEESVGKAVRDSGIDRKEIFITTKVPAEIKSYQKAKEIINRSLELLNCEYIDLLLIHAPKPWSEMYPGSPKNYDSENAEVWKAMIETYREGKVKAIGVSNFGISDIENLIKQTGFKPMANQIRFFIGYTQNELTNYCQANRILVEGYSPLATGRILNNPEIQRIANKYQKTLPQICIRYLIQKNVLPLPKSTHAEFIAANTEIDFEISASDMEYLDSLKDTDK